MTLALPGICGFLDQFGENVLLRDATGHVVHYLDVHKLAQSEAFRVTRRRLVMCCINNDIDGLEGYLALLAANAVPMMVNPTLSKSGLDALIATYQPDFLWIKNDARRRSSAEMHSTMRGYALIDLKNGSCTTALHEDLSLLLSTSGSTGNVKYVRLSHQNVWSNAIAIADYLALSANELPVTTLPPSYSYGLSIIHSHLCVGAGIAVNEKTFFDRDLWRFMLEVKATSFAGVPYHYEILKKLRFTKMDLPHLRTLTQAGGHMSPDMTQEFASHCQKNGMRFFTMYGQTEASPRISYVPAEQAFQKAGKIGIPIPGGALELLSETGTVIADANVVGEMVYRGPNVCLGYAESRGDLLLGDVNCGVLRTGDLGERDDDGYYRIVGRQKQFIKLFGNRVNMQDVELALAPLEMDIACSGREDLLEIYLVTGTTERALEIKKRVMGNLRVGAKGIVVYGVDAIPRNESGKVLYANLDPENARILA